MKKVWSKPRIIAKWQRKTVTRDMVIALTVPYVLECKVPLIETMNDMGYKMLVDVPNISMNELYTRFNKVIRKHARTPMSVAGNQLAL